MSKNLPELYVATDVEADGPIPGPYSMISFGMTVVGKPKLCFYTELKPISKDFQQQALEISGLDRERLIQEAPHPRLAMMKAADWINSLFKIGRPVFLAAPSVWDGMFIHWYFIKFLNMSPFGPTGSGIDLRSYWMGLTGCEWTESRIENIKNSLSLNRIEHKHHALEDAKEISLIFNSILNKLEEMKKE